MATGTFITAKLMRSDQSTPWGFRLQGGQEFQMPLSMAKVSEGSLAEQSGVCLGDIILKINGKECDQMRHKDAQDQILNAGNYLELYLERGPMNTWKPTVTPVGSFDISQNNKAQSMEPQIYTKTSLAKNPEEYAGIGSGHNSTAQPFNGPKLVHKQFNSPINLYSDKALEETLNAHSQVLATGATGINFIKPEQPVNKDSAVYRLVQEEEEMRKSKGLSDSPEKNGFHDPSSIDGPIRHVTAPSGPCPQKQIDERNRNVCAHCERLIVGVFVRINNKSLHADCFVCATCGTSLKNVGYFNINDKLYCDIHARQMRAVLGETGGQGFPSAPDVKPAPLGFSQQQQQQRQHISPLSQSPQTVPQPREISIPVQSYQSTNLQTQNGFQSSSPNFNTMPKKFSPIAPPKPNFSPSQTNRNSMYGSMASQSPSSYNYTTETHSTVQRNLNQPIIQPSMAPSNPAADYLSSSLAKQMNRPKSCYSSLPQTQGNYSVTTNTYETRTATTKFPGSPCGVNPNNLPYPKTATYASSQTTTYSTPIGSAGPAGTQPMTTLPSAYSAKNVPNYNATQQQRQTTTAVNSSSTTTSFGNKQTSTTDMNRMAPKRGKGMLQNQLTGGVIPFCGYCSQPIRGQYIMALNKTWCPNHFICANNLCKRSLEQNGFVEEQDRLYCENCYETHFAPSCAKCFQRIKGDCLNALGKKWHPECFTCTHCRKPFGNSEFYLEDSFPYCEKDWNDLFTTKCVGCGYPIAAGDRWVEALNQNYHSNCFRCTVCHNNLEGQSFFAKGGRPYCKAHAR
ncbi:Z band alternatively spliced PDZ-motif protein 52 isoform X2 [Dermatophagoides farinae]|uniref:Z band alternatively spliced PDZ-motif protein 52 isoform X2 n=1 Tax=Dermatophagoides farinae TaxID=6954 RepID=UPI003F61CA4C